MESKSDPIIVLITTPTDEEAQRIAEMLVNKKLAACVQILPSMTSIYVWQGEVQRDRENLLLVKTSGGKFDELDREIRAIHSYETPEIIALPIVAGSEPYLAWLSASLEGS